MHPYTIESNAGCDSTIVLDLRYIDAVFANIFSPNGDEINDVFTYQGPTDDVASFSISIFDRWGNKVFVGQEWTGISNNSPASPGVYVYQCNVVLNSGSTKTFMGDVTLIR